MKLEWESSDVVTGARMVRDTGLTLEGAKNKPAHIMVVTRTAKHPYPAQVGVVNLDSGEIEVMDKVGSEQTIAAFLNRYGYTPEPSPIKHPAEIMLGEDVIAGSEIGHVVAHEPGDDPKGIRVWRKARGFSSLYARSSVRRRT